MDDQHEALPNPVARAATIVLVLLLVLVLYVLGIGPAARYSASHDDKSSLVRAMAAIYAPILSLGEKSETVGRVVMWYLDLWAPARVYQVAPTGGTI